MKIQSKIEKLIRKGGGKIDNDNISDNATFVKYIFDNALKEVILYEADPINDLTSKFSPLAISFKSYVDSGLPLKIVMPIERAKIASEVPLAIKYIDMPPKKPNVEVKLASNSFKEEMSKLLSGHGKDFIACDDNYLSRVSDSNDPTNQKNKGEINVYTKRYNEAYNYFVKNFDNLKNF